MLEVSRVCESTCFYPNCPQNRGIEFRRTIDGLCRFTCFIHLPVLLLHMLEDPQARSIVFQTLSQRQLDHMNQWRRRPRLGEPHFDAPCR
jgi:hypothetical protein